MGIRPKINKAASMVTKNRRKMGGKLKIGIKGTKR